MLYYFSEANEQTDSAVTIYKSLLKDKCHQISNSGLDALQLSLLYLCKDTIIRGAAQLKSGF